jgi:hypothetical protein
VRSPGLALAQHFSSAGALKIEVFSCRTFRKKKMSDAEQF